MNSTTLSNSFLLALRAGLKITMSHLTESAIAATNMAMLGAEERHASANASAAGVGVFSKHLKVFPNLRGVETMTSEDDLVQLLVFMIATLCVVHSPL